MQDGKADTEVLSESRHSTDGEAGAANIDKIRDILFGAQVRDFEMRMKRLEADLMRESENLRDTLIRRIDALEAFAKKELETLELRLRSERDEREEAGKSAGREAAQVAESLARKIEQFHDESVKGQSELRGELLAQSRNLSDEVMRLRGELLGSLDRRFTDLNGAKTDRATLAALLTEVALQLSGDAPDSNHRE